MKLALAGQTRNCMVVLGCMLTLTYHLNDLWYFIKVTDTEISHNGGNLNKFIYRL